MSTVNVIIRLRYVKFLETEAQVRKSPRPPHPPRGGYPDSWYPQNPNFFSPAAGLKPTFQTLNLLFTARYVLNKMQLTSFWTQSRAMCLYLSSVLLFVFSKPKHFEHQISKSLVITVFLTARRRREKFYLFDRFSIDFTFQNGTKIWNFLISEPKFQSKPKHFRFQHLKT